MVIIAIELFLERIIIVRMILSMCRYNKDWLLDERFRIKNWSLS